MEASTTEKPHKPTGLRHIQPLLIIAASSVVVLAGAIAVPFALNRQPSAQSPHGLTSPQDQSSKPQQPSKPGNPLSDMVFYVDRERDANKLAAEYKQSGQTENAALMSYIAEQPGAIWLTGPTDSDKTAMRDVQVVERTSSEAASKGTVPVYQLYAIPKRDACAAYSKGGFATGAAYLEWIDKLTGALKTKSVIAVEADAIAHTIKNSCLNAQQTAERYTLLKEAVARLNTSPNVVAVYLDAGHPDWLPDPNLLVEPLRKSGIDQARGVVVNVSFFAETPAVTSWSQQLVELLGGNKGVMIDTSRNGKGIANASGDARWCNPSGRGTGHKPTTMVADKHIDAYFWGKVVGESDGACFGYPAAGTFVPAIALELSRNGLR